MKIGATKKSVLFGSILYVVSAFGYDASTITPVDWSALGAGATYTVPAGTTNHVAEADIGYVNALALVKFGDAAAALLFTSTTAPAVKFSGKGTVIKEGVADWKLSKLQDDSSWLGNWDIVEGTVRLGTVSETANTTFTLFSWNSTWRTCRVRKDATLVYDASASFYCIELRLAGTFKVAANGPSAMFNSVVIDDDAAVIDQTDGKYSWFSRPSDDGGVALDLNGHKLTCKLGTNIYNSRGYVMGPGTIRLENATAKMYSFVTRNSKACGFPDPTVTVECGDNTGIQHQAHPATNQVATLVIEGSTLFLHQHNNDSVPACPTSPDDTNWAGLFWDGPVVLKNAGSTLELAHVPTGGNHAHMGVSGPVSGPGSLKFAASKTSYTQTSYHLSCPTNTYAGTTTLTGRDGTSYYFCGSNAIPNTAGVTSTSDGFHLAFDPARDDNWTLAKIVDLYRAGAYSYMKYRPKLLTKNGELVLLDGAGLAALGVDDVFEPLIVGDGEVKISAPFGDAVFAPHFADPANTPTLTLSGNGTFAVTNKPTTNSTLDFDGLLHVTDNARADLCGLPFAASSVKGNAPRIKFSNGGMTVLRGVRADEYYNDRVTNVLAVGHCNGTGRVEIAEGSLLTNRVIVGNYASISERTRGVVRQTGGELAVIGQYKDASMNYTSQLGLWGQGGYSLESGTLTLLGSVSAANYGNAVLRQTGGVLKMVTYPWVTGTADQPVFSTGFNGGSADLIFAGGRADFGNGLVYLARQKTGAVVTTVTVAGDAFVTAKSWYQIGTEGQVTVNLLGGTIAGRWRPYDAFRDTWINFDGGAYLMTESLYLGYFGNIYTWAENQTSCPVRLNVGPNGGTLDATNFYQQVWVPFTAPQGGVVKSIPWTDTETVYPAPPTVVITGDGQHATAYADFDYATGKIKGIVVTCGGEGYKAATAQLEYQRQNPSYPKAHEELLAEPISCVIDEHPVSGGMTFRASGVASGSNYIGLHCTNTYAGATTVDMQYDAAAATPGQLIIEADNIFPNSHRLVMKSGWLHFDYTEQNSFEELVVLGGKMSHYKLRKTFSTRMATFGGSSELEGVSLSVSDRLVVDAANPPAIAGGTIALGDGAVLTACNAASLAGLPRAKTLFVRDFGENVTVEQPADLPANVKLTYAHGVLKARRTDLGSVLVVR